MQHAPGVATGHHAHAACRLSAACRARQVHLEHIMHACVAHAACMPTFQNGSAVASCHIPDPGGVVLGDGHSLAPIRRQVACVDAAAVHPRSVSVPPLLEHTPPLHCGQAPHRDSAVKEDDDGNGAVGAGVEGLDTAALVACSVATKVWRLRWVHSSALASLPGGAGRGREDWAQGPSCGPHCPDWLWRSATRHARHVPSSWGGDTRIAHRMQAGRALLVGMLLRHQKMPVVLQRSRAGCHLTARSRHAEEVLASRQTLQAPPAKNHSFG